MIESWRWPDGPPDISPDPGSTSVKLFPIKGRADRFIMCHEGDWIVKRSDGTYMAYIDLVYRSRFAK